MKSKTTVLIVDDEKIMRDVLARSVSRHGCTVDQATDGQDALDKLAISPFDIVITDIKMPGMDGIELLSEIKVQYPEVSVIIVTAYSDTHTPADILKAGADMYITKPFKSFEIAEALRAIITIRLRQQKTVAASK